LFCAVILALMPWSTPAKGCAAVPGMDSVAKMPIFSGGWLAPAPEDVATVRPHAMAIAQKVAPRRC